jgi:hypothetical protein
MGMTNLWAVFCVYYIDDLLHFDSQVVPKAFEQDTHHIHNSKHQNGTNHYSDPILQAFLTKDTINIRAQKEAVFDHRKIELITQRLFEQLVRHLFCLRVAEHATPKQSKAM